MPLLIELLLVVLLVAINGFFVAAEFAMIRVRRTRIEELAEQGRATSKVVLRILGRLDTFLAATQLGITMANLGLGWIGEPVMQDLLGPVFHLLHIGSPHLIRIISVVVGFAIITVVEVVFGELLPKWSVIQDPEKASHFVAYPMDIFVRIFYLPVVFLKGLAGFFARLIHINPAAVGAHDSAHSEDEIIAIVEAAELSGTIGQSEAEIVDNVFEFAHTQAKEIMVPRVDIVALNTEWSVSHCVEVAQASGFTRFPLCEHDRDHIIGMVHVKDLLTIARRENADIKSVMREIPAVPETKRIDELLREMQRSHSQMAVVLDEYGGTAGLVTLEDIIEELVGEIQDEYDRPAPIERLLDGRVAIAGVEPLDTVTEELGLTLDGGEDYQTIGGYARHVLGLSPQTGASAHVGAYTVTVAEAYGQRISRLIFAKVEMNGNGNGHATKPVADPPPPPET